MEEESMGDLSALPTLPTLLDFQSQQIGYYAC